MFAIMMVVELEAIKSVRQILVLEISRRFKPGWETGKGLQGPSAETLPPCALLQPQDDL